MTVGDDFAYFNAEETFNFTESWTKLILKKTRKYKFVPSTPSIFLKAVR